MVANNGLRTMIDNARIVSFDIFDTSVLRKVKEPVDVFDALAHRWILAGHKSLEGFKVFRQEAELVARARKQDREDHEVTLQEIYDVMQDILSLNSSDINLLMRMEVSLEKELIVRNNYIFSIYSYAIRMNKKVIFISDTYFDKETIDEILGSAGYTNRVSLFVSSSYGVSKANGLLYDRVLQELAVDAASIIHIGDNYGSDVDQATAKGLKAHYYNKALHVAAEAERRFALPEIPQIEKGLTWSLVEAASINKFYSWRGESHSFSSDFWYRLGYSKLGILLFGFSTWLLDSARANNLDYLYFLSRDGHILKQHYDIVANGVTDAPPSTYMYASRRALNIPAISVLDEQSLDFLLGSSDEARSPSQLLSRIGLDPEAYVSAITHVGLTLHKKLLTNSDRDRMRSLFLSIESEVLAQATKERGLVQQYFDELNLSRSDRVGIVDIGWHGSMQNSISSILERSTSRACVFGYYLATNPKANKYAGAGRRMSGYLCNFGAPWFMYEITLKSIQLLEFVCSAPHPTVVGLKREGALVQPVFADPDVSALQSSRADVLQRGSLDFAQDMAIAWRQAGYPTVSRETAIHPFAQVLYSPTVEEARALGNLEHMAAFGGNMGGRYIAKPVPLKRLVKNPYQVVLSYQQAYWKAGYRRRVFGLTQGEVIVKRSRSLIKTVVRRLKTAHL